MQDSTFSRDELDARPSPRRPAADSHGQAALLLSESILHALVEAKTLTLGQAIDVVQTASEVAEAMGEEIDGGGSHTQQSFNLLLAIEHSLATGKVGQHRTNEVVMIKP